MPPAKKRVAKPEPVEELEFGQYADKEPTAVHEACAQWIEENVGYEVDLKSVQLTALLYGKFQRSPENQERIAAQKTNSAKLAETREERATKRTSKKAAAPTRRRAAAEDDAEDEEEAPAKGRRAPGRATAVAPAKKTATRGRRRPAPAEAADEEFDDE